VEREVERELQKIASVKGPWVERMPEVSILRVRVDGSGEHDLVYSLIHNVAHTNVAFMFGEDRRLVPADDTMSVVRGVFGSYPNLVFEVEAGEVGAFVGGLRGVASESQFAEVVKAFGVRRTDPRVWGSSDWITVEAKRSDPTTAGVRDLDRYVNP